MLSLQSSLNNHYEQRVRQYDLNLSIVRKCLQKGANASFFVYPTGNAINVTVDDLRSHVPAESKFSMDLVGSEKEAFMAWIKRNPTRIA